MRHGLRALSQGRPTAQHQAAMLCMAAATVSSMAATTRNVDYSVELRDDLSAKWSGWRPSLSWPPRIAELDKKCPSVLSKVRRFLGGLAGAATPVARVSGIC